MENKFEEEELSSDEEELWILIKKDSLKIIERN